MARNKVIFDVLANSSQYQAQMAGIEKTTTQTSKAIIAAFAISSIAIGGTLKAFAEYETLLIKVGKTADLQGKELRDFGKEITDMSARLPLSTKELLDLAASAAQIGVKGKDNILKFTETVAKLGTATNIVGEEGTKQIARLLNITGEGTGVVGRFGAVITRLGNSAAASEREILSMASEVGKATTQFDLGTTKVLGMSSALVELGIQVEVGGSVLGRVFIEMQKAISNGGDELKGFLDVMGLTRDELTQIFEKDATKAFQIFIEGLNKLPASEFINALDQMGLNGVRFNKVLAPLSKNVNILTKNLALARDEAEKQTALNIEFKRAVDSLANSWIFLKTEVFNAAVSMGTDLAPAAKELIRDITGLIKGIREFNEATGGTITTSIVMAAKISALIIVANRLKAVLIATGIVSGVLADQTLTLGNRMGAAAVKGSILSTSFKSLGASIKSAGLALKGFQVTLGTVTLGLFAAWEIGIKLGKVLGNLAPDASANAELIRTRETLNTLLGIRNRLEKKAAEGDKGAADKLEKLNREITQHEGLVKVLEREIARKETLAITPTAEAQAIEAVDEAAVLTDNTEFAEGEAEKTDILQKEIELRLAAANREAELLKDVQMGMSAEAISIAEERNNQLDAIDKKKLELQEINQKLAKTNIKEGEQENLEIRKLVAEQELILLQEKFVSQEELKAEQDLIDLENRIAAKEMLNIALTDQELLFLEQKRERDIENREIDLELKNIQNEEDLLILQTQLITEQQAKDAVRKEELDRIAREHTQRLKDEAKFGQSAAKMKAFFRSDEVKATIAVLDTIGQIQLEEGSKAAKIQKAFAIANATIKISESAISAFAAMAGIPVTGPALAIAAAAKAIALGLPHLAVIQGVNPSFAVGTDFVAQDTLAQIHRGESIIPARQNQFLQSGNLVLGSPETINNQQETTEQIENAPSIILNFEGANFIGALDSDIFINQIEEAIAIGIDEGRLVGFQQANIAVT